MALGKISREADIRYYINFPKSDNCDICHVEVCVDLDKILLDLGPRAARSKGGRSQVMKGAVVVKRLSDPVASPSWHQRHPGQ